MALWQPLVPVFATGTSIVLGFENVTRIKLIGFLTCSLVVIWNIVDDLVDETTKSLHLSKKHTFLLGQIVALTAAMISQKKILMKGRLGLFSLAFWAYFFGAIGTFCLFLL